MHGHAGVEAESGVVSMIPVASPDLGKWGRQNNDVITTTQRNDLMVYHALLLGLNDVSAVLQQLSFYE